MPAVCSGKILVTGANGYVATWIVRMLLGQGFTVRGTVRSEAKAVSLREEFTQDSDRLEIVVVEDMTKAGAFDEVVDGIDAIMHTASPLHYNAMEPSEIIVPAVLGTTRVLESALAHGNLVKRIVITSSCASVMQVQDTPRVFSESDWNDAALAEVEEKGVLATQQTKYRASKILAERAAWEFTKENKDNISWDLVVLNPPYVFGPPIGRTATLESLSESLRDWYRNIFQGGKTPEELPVVGQCWIDVRDLADAHILAMNKQEAGGERIVVYGGPFKWQDWVNAARGCGAAVPLGDKSYDPAKAAHYVLYDTSRAARLLDIKYRTIMECTRDTIEDFKGRGWI
ncbi:uncharacterized protein FIBRA_03959 [Fibroporia radiculosa]|uniref:NAD-dependent epimerase/dehydratase domain-containing protein n=1 Tax=Fibroporia radiculosa TaxID=599839 RepID=J4G6M9_9APHY|nr:uncharacterized protein FIBRA_03959 [Fibroporia radiculosa]CCM01888.1 predicted protein [Fibroporia radiculosa]